MGSLWIERMQVYVVAVDSPKVCVMRPWFIHVLREMEERLHEHCLQANDLQIHAHNMSKDR